MGKILKWEIRIILILTVFLMIIAIVGIMPLDSNEKNGELRIPFKSGEIIQEKMTTIKVVLEDSGFTNINVTSEKTEDYEQDGRVKSFEVDDQPGFFEDKYYPKDVNIDIVYFEYKKE